jgi:hypothetical protein
MKLTFILFILFSLTASFAPKAQPLPEYCPEPLKLVYYGDWYPYMYAKNAIYKGTDWTFLLKVLKVLNCQIDVVKIPERRAHKDLSKRNPLGACPRIERELRGSWFESVFALLLGE